MGYEDDYILLTGIKYAPGYCYMVFVPGRHVRNRVKNNVAFLEEDSMDVIEDLLEHANSKYDHYENTYFNSKQVSILLDGLSARLAGIKNDNIYKLPEDFYIADFVEYRNEIIKENIGRIIKLFEDLIAWISVNRDRGFTVIGM